MPSRYYADLHCHSNASDGSDVPSRVAERASEEGLQVIALTDHDTVAGVREAQETGARLGVRVIPGVELTCYAGKREVHILGYGIDIENKNLLEHCERFQEARISRAREIGRRLEECGVPVNIDAVMASADGGVVGRPHVARALIEAGYVSDFQEAFDKYLADGMPANVPKLQVDPTECISVILDAGGIAVMAHPALGEQYDLIPEMIAAGCRGIEVWHSAHDNQITDRLDAIALDHGYLKTGGSDCHGTVKGAEPLLGRFGLNKAQWEKFEKALNETGAATG